MVMITGTPALCNCGWLVLLGFVSSIRDETETEFAAEVPWRPLKTNLHSLFIFVLNEAADNKINAGYQP